MLLQIAFHIRHDKAQILDLVASTDTQLSEMLAVSDSVAAFLHIVLRRFGNPVDRIDQFFLCMP